MKPQSRKVELAMVGELLAQNAVVRAALGRILEVEWCECDQQNRFACALCRVRKIAREALEYPVERQTKGDA